MTQTLAERRFSLEDQQWFGLASGDVNPIHVDPIAARRLLAGEVVVHGIHGLLWSLEQYLAAGGAAPVGLSTTFTAPVLTDRPIRLERDDEAGGRVRLSLVHGGVRLASTVVVPGGGPGSAGAGPGSMASTPGVPEGRPEIGEPAVLSPEQLQDCSGALRVRAHPSDLRGAFPACHAALGPLPVAGLMALSRLVGMECPGLHSLFASLDLTREPEASEPSIEWRVVRFAPPPAPVRIELRGAGWTGRLTAFVRPEPVEQPTIEDVARVVPNGRFAGQKALVVGGSRGLGEIAAKVVAAGGGEVIATWHRGEADARRVEDEIRRHGLNCRFVPWDATALGPAPGVAFTHLYYFAAPRIGKTTGFDPDLYAALDRVFVRAFGVLASSLPPNAVVFYPSTVFLDENPPGFAEYIAAKAAGEALCVHLARHRKDLRFLVKRLPRLSTDQNATLVRRRTEDALPLIIDIVTEMHRTSVLPMEPS